MGDGHRLDTVRNRQRRYGPGYVRDWCCTGRGRYLDEILIPNAPTIPNLRWVNLVVAAAVVAVAVAVVAVAVVAVAVVVLAVGVLAGVGKGVLIVYELGLLIVVRLELDK